MRVCHCVGHLNNPGGACCRDLQVDPPSWIPQVPTPGGLPFPPQKKIKFIEYYENGTIKKIVYFDDRI